MKKRKKRVFPPTFCIICGNEFIPNASSAKYCDDECRKLGQIFCISETKATQTEEGLSICPSCGNEFTPNRPDQKFCCLDCAKKYLAFKRIIPPKICEICGNEFTPNRPNQRTCSDKCRNKLAQKKWQEVYKKKQETPVQKKPKKYTAEEWNALTPAERWEQMKLKGIEAECLRLGVSYGKLQTMYYNGTLPNDFGIKKRKTRKAVKK